MYALTLAELNSKDIYFIFDSTRVELKVCATFGDNVQNLNFCLSTEGIGQKNYNNLYRKPIGKFKILPVGNSKKFRKQKIITKQD